MKKNLLTFLTGLALATVSAQASDLSVATVPTGMITFTLTHGTTSYISLPLTQTETYTSSVTAVTGNTISVGDAPAPFTSNLAISSTPYFVKFLSGSQIGRVVLITANTTSALTLDTTDHSTGSPVLLNATGFSVVVGDTFEIFPGDTLASVFGAQTTQSPLVVTGGTNIITADTVSLFTSVTAPALTYYFNTTTACWVQYGSTVNANNTIIYPYSAFAVTRRTSNGDTTFVAGGKVSAVAAQTKVVGNGSIYSSTHMATDVTLSQLQFGANWTTGASIITADTVSVWDSASGQFDTYYEKPDSTWRKYPDATTDQSNFVIPAGTVTTISKHEMVAGSANFVQSPLPYSLD